MVGSGPWKETNSPFVIKMPNRGLASTTSGCVAVVGAYAQEVAVAHAEPGLDEAVSDAVAKAKGIEHILPVSATEYEGLAVFHLPGEELWAHAPPWVEVDVFDAANVVDAIDVDAPTQRLTGYVAYQVTSVAGGIDAVIRIEQLDL